MDADAVDAAAVADSVRAAAGAEWGPEDWAWDPPAFACALNAGGKRRINPGFHA